jgi:hypothetical protein
LWECSDEERLSAQDAELVFLNGACVKHRHGPVGWRADGEDMQPPVKDEATVGGFGR